MNRRQESSINKRQFENDEGDNSLLNSEDENSLVSKNFDTSFEAQQPQKNRKVSNLQSQGDYRKRDSQLPENYSQICKELQEGDQDANRRFLEEELAFLTKEHNTAAVLNSAFVSLNDNLETIRKKLSTLEKNANCTESLLSCWNQFLIRTMNNFSLVSDPSWPGERLEENRPSEPVSNEMQNQQNHESYSVEPEPEPQLDLELETASLFSQKRSKRQSLRALYRDNTLGK